MPRFVAPSMIFRVLAEDRVSIGRQKDILRDKGRGKGRGEGLGILGDGEL
jgi:hypothetical protein